jgi:hypothetical protein
MHSSACLLTRHSETLIMKRNFFVLIILAILFAQYGNAQLTENFNPRSGVAIARQKGYLQNHCWTISDRTGIYTPVLDVPAQMTVSFSYQFTQPIEKGTRRWINIYLADANNMIISKLDSMECTNSTAGSSWTYNKNFAALQPGIFKLFINPQGTGGSSRMAIDQVTVSAPLHYAGGCNTSPVAMNDNINGLPDHIASGQVTANDKDPDQDGLTAYLVSNSPDGTVALQPDGRFTFTPRPGFTGNSTSFSYRVCDNGSGKLCSQDAKVTLHFPAEAISLNDFKGLYNGNGEVAISWATSFEQNSSRFEVERSFDGVKWHSAGSIKAQGVSSIKRSYGFVDEVGRNAAHKKDLYYRLKQINEDGKVALSRLMVVRVYNTRALKMVSVTPNPAINDIGVTTQLNETSYVAMKIFDASGAVVLNKTLKAQAGDNSFIMEGSSRLQPGSYMLDVTVNSKERMMVKLIKE